MKNKKEEAEVIDLEEFRARKKKESIDEILEDWEDFVWGMRWNKLQEESSDPFLQLDEDEEEDEEQ